jgi:DNA repair and recombination protein RAD52
VVSTFFAKVRITVYAKEGGHSVIREGCGAARGFAKTAGEAMENAIKSAETDAMKRALVTFGDQFGLTLYDKEQRNVCSASDRRP